MALIRGDRLLIKPPKGKGLPGRYALYPDEAYRREQDKELNTERSDELAAFIQSAMQSLRDMNILTP